PDELESFMGWRPHPAEARRRAAVSAPGGGEVMGGIRHRITVVALALLALSCASSNELARRSEMALRAHDYERAYHEARAALGKDRSNGRARMALSTAASHLIDQREQRILNLAASDTVAAADGCLELEMLRAQALGEGATLPEHPDFAATAGVI